MATWKVSAERIALLPHPGAERLEVARVGLHQIVVPKGAYSDGDTVVFAPKRSILPASVHERFWNSEKCESYLADGRVCSRRMRGEPSEGVALPADWVEARLGMAIGDLREGEDLSVRLGISEYEYPLPPELDGRLETLPFTDLPLHDVEGFNAVRGMFADGEDVTATEKVNGSQVCAICTPDRIYVTTKALLRKGRAYLEVDESLYWRAVRLSRLEKAIRCAFPGAVVQVFAEVVPAIRKFGYGFTKDAPALALYRVEVDGARLRRDAAEAAIDGQFWAPLLYRGPYDLAALKSVACGRETLSGRSVHIREGVVVEPIVPRDALPGIALCMKVLNPDFRDDDATPS